MVIVTGELSGEIHAYHLVQALANTVDIEWSGIGSNRLKELGVRIIHDYRTISLTGFSEVFAKLRHIRHAYKLLARHLVETQPSLLVLVDFPGFNLRVARIAKRYGIPVVYFIPPQIWAWRKGRIRKIKKLVDKVICILPFEKPLYEGYGMDATYVGHPFINTVKPTCTKDDFLRKTGIPEGSTLITIMPGSRENEIKKHMPLLLPIVAHLQTLHPGLTVLLPVAENMEYTLVEKHLGGSRGIKLLKGSAHEALACSELAIIASGSATLEAAILGVPAIVVYKMSLLSYLLARLLVRVQYISLPNIVAGKELFPEYIQHIKPKEIAEKAHCMLNNDREQFEKGIEDIKMKLGSHDSYVMARDAVVSFLEGLYGTIPKIT
jgi:lipid-A-disaccharide synthase